MDCTDIKALLSAFLDGELDDAARHDVERHLASCDACRAFVSEAESLDALVALEARELAGETRISAGFEAAVLNRTVYAGRHRALAWRRWTNWAGWTAAAACVALGVFILVTDSRNDAERASGGLGMRADNHPLIVPASYERALALRSTVLDDDFAPSPAREREPKDSAIDSAAAETDTHNNQADVAAADDRGVLALLSRDEAEALSAVSLALELLRVADRESFADVERVRRIVEYDELLTRAAAAREHLRPADRAVVLAAEGILWRASRGPVSMEDVQEMRETIARMNLPQRLEALSDEWAAMHSL